MSHSLCRRRCARHRTFSIEGCPSDDVARLCGRTAHSGPIEGREDFGSSQWRASVGRVSDGVAGAAWRPCPVIFSRWTPCRRSEGGRRSGCEAQPLGRPDPAGSGDLRIRPDPRRHISALIACSGGGGGVVGSRCGPPHPYPLTRSVCGTTRVARVPRCEWRGRGPAVDHMQVILLHSSRFMIRLRCGLQD